MSSRAFSVRFSVGPAHAVRDSWVPPAPPCEPTFATGQLETHAGLVVFNGYLEFGKQIYASQMKGWLTKDTPGATLGSGYCDFVPTKLTDRDMHIRHCTDAEERYVDADNDSLVKPAPWKMGTTDRKAVTQQGKRSDFEAIRDIMVEHGAEAGMRIVARDFTGQFVRYSQAIAQLPDVLREQVHDKDFKPLPWQAAMIDIVRGPVNKRHIWW